MSAANSNFLERAPIELRDWAVQLLPTPLQWLAHHLITIVAILAVFGLFFAFTTIAERKLLARLQNRRGPNRTGVPRFSILPCTLSTRSSASANRSPTPSRPSPRKTSSPPPPTKSCTTSPPSSWFRSR